MKLWKKLLWAGLCLASLLGFWLLYRGDRQTVAELTPQQAAENWETAEKPYAMASVFLPEDSGILPSRMGEFYLAVENALTAAGVGSEEYPWYYAASYRTTATLTQDGASCDVELTAVAGEFFRIHPMELLTGWYFDEEDLMHDRIVLDRQTAWDLFYTDDAAGQYLAVDGVTYQVAAVVDTEAGTYNDLACGDTRRAWVLADSLTGADETETGYTCMEVVLPQPVKNFAANTLKSALGDMIPETTTVTDNSGRFSLSARWDVLRNLETRGISSEAIAYPYWENAARLTENHLALRLAPEALCLAVPILSLVIVLLWLNHRRTWGLHSLRDAAENAVDRKRQRDYAARQEGRESPREEKKRRRREARRQRQREKDALRYRKENRRRRRR